MKPVRPGQEAAGDERERAEEPRTARTKPETRSATPRGLTTSVDVTNTMTASGTRMTRSS